jgi:dipeptidyl aminopeptidase/acylaminoacyl peptidase
LTKRFLSDRAADGLAFTFLAASVLVLIWFLFIALSPEGPWNPLPPVDADAGGVQAAAAAGPATTLPTWPATWTPTATGTPTPTPTVTPTPTQTPTRRPPTPTNTPNPRLSYYITRLRKQTFKGGQVRITGEIPQSEAYTAHYISYPSDRLTISGYMYVPHGDGPFPVAILNHGFYDPEFYFTGTGTQRAADYLAREGYVAIAPDYRNYGESDAGQSLMLVGYVEDVLNLVASLDSIDGADPSRVGLWGHSMGGGISIKAAVISDEIDAVALFGSVAADEEDNYYWNGITRSKVRGVFGTPEQSPGPYAWASPINYLDFAPPTSIHHGEADTEVPIQFSEKLYTAMRGAGRTVEYFTYPGQEHTFQGEGWDLAMERVLAFFDRYLK